MKFTSKFGMYCTVVLQGPEVTIYVWPIQSQSMETSAICG